VPRFGPIKRRDLIRYLRLLGFEGPYSGGRHQFMLRADTTIRLPNPHQGDVGRDILVRILRQAHVSREEWEALSG
jgi:predicted RNA binding protein YcfA (HicA-like mRNA interferase family)